VSAHGPSLTAGDARMLEDCVRGGGIAVFPADTVYGLCCDPANAAAAARLYELKGRPPARPAAVMFFSLELALAALHELGAGERAALRALLPGPVTLLVANSARRYAAACGPVVETLGLRVPDLSGPLAALRELAVPVMQSSANLSGGRDARALEEVPASIRAGADLVLDAGELPGVASTVVDISGYARGGVFRVVREGALSAREVERALAGSG
jgi:L-threonylcarbamoyladenylate synthase